MTDKNINYTDVLIKIGSKTVLKGSVHFQDNTGKKILFKTVGPKIDPELFKEIEDSNDLHVTATGSNSATVFTMQKIKYENSDKDHKEWRFRFV
jgi:hypothetical protein